MGIGEDRISNLPDSVLQTILTLIPLKSAIRTEILSKKWRNLWKYSLSIATSLEFGQDMSNHLSTKQFVETVNKYLSFNQSKNIENFHVFFSPTPLFFPQIEKWITFATGKKVRNLNIDLSKGFTNRRNRIELPSSLFDCDSLIDLSLSRFNFKNPLNLSNFGGLKSLSISHSNICDEMLRSILTQCLLLESLSLKDCQKLDEIIISDFDLKLKMLTIGDCNSAHKVGIVAPKLQSFHYFGKICVDTYVFSGLLSEVLIQTIGRESKSELTTLLSYVLDVQILTLCEATLVHLNIGRANSPGENFDGFLMELRNLKELQLLMTSMADEDLSCFFTFFCFCSAPLLEKLFIRLPKHIDDSNVEKYWASVLNPPSLDKISTLDQLKVIKVTNFEGSRNEMRLVSFFLQKAPILETLVLVLPVFKNRNDKERLNLRDLKGQVLILRKVSLNVQIILHENEEDDVLNPTHMDIYNDYFF